MRILLVTLALLGCGGRETPNARGADAQGAEEGWVSTRMTQGRKYQVSLSLVPDPPPMSELFTVRAVVTDRDGKPLETAKVTLDARMPQHDHGMMTDPVNEPGVCDDEGNCRHPGGVYETTGFKFHMGGEWTILVQVEGPMGPDNTSFVYDMK